MTASRIAWLDHDAKARERSIRLMALFRERSTRDELGLGAVRDNIADILFPGTSTIQTRLRYMLFIPWLYGRIEREIAHGHLERGMVGARMAALEFEIVDALGDERGVFGKSSGRKLKRLPSSVYWAGLGSWGIRAMPWTQDQYHRNAGPVVARRAEATARTTEGDDAEPDERTRTWHPTLPPEPDGFPREAVLALTREEAAFILDRVRECHPTSLLAHLFERCDPADSEYPWHHPDRADFSAAQQELLQHAEKLAVLAHGAFLLYNLALSELRGVEEWVQLYRDRFAEWVNESQSFAFHSWDLQQLFDLVQSGTYRLSEGARTFLRNWLSLVVEHQESPGVLQQHTEARQLIRDRETLLKKARARFTNPEALRQWGGGSSTGRYTFRWPTVTQFHRDLHAALGAS